MRHTPRLPVGYAPRPRFGAAPKLRALSHARVDAMALGRVPVTPSVPRISWDAWCRAKYEPAGLGDRSEAQHRLPLLDDADRLRPEITLAAEPTAAEGAS